jgi:hypothetical protein
VAATDRRRDVTVVPASATVPRPAGARVRSWRAALLAAVGAFVAGSASAVVLPEDRTDLLYHYYKGGGVTVQGPALLVRQGVGDSLSLSGRYYVDTVSSASIDVITTASPYKDERKEYGIGVDYLHGNSLAQFSVSSSKEDDYLADTFGMNVSHDLFGGLTTLNLGFSQGRDVVQRVDTAFEADINRYNFRLGLTQVLSRSLLLGVGYEGVAEEGYLNNPYRSVRVLGATREERYPGTRDSQAVALRAIKGFGSGSRPVISSLRAEYRYFRDNWGVRSSTLGVALQRYFFGERVLGEARYRYYRQSAASFYSDDFPTEMTYMARDKELSTFHSHSLGVKWSWAFWRGSALRASVNLAHDYLVFDYDDFTDVRNGQPYSFDANVLQLFLSAWY